MIKTYDGKLKALQEKLMYHQKVTFCGFIFQLLRLEPTPRASNTLSSDLGNNYETQFLDQADKLLH